MEDSFFEDSLAGLFLFRSSTSTLQTKMLTSRRLATHSANRLGNAATTSVTTARAANHHRIYLTKAKPKKGKNQHVRSYQSSLKNPYYAADVTAFAQAPAAGAASVSFMKRAFQWYSEKLSTHPLSTKCLTGGIIAAAGDVLCQAGTYSPKTSTTKDDDQDKEKSTLDTIRDTMEEFFQGGGWDYRRSFHFFVLGLTFVAPTSHYWYGGMAKHAWTRGQSMKQITKRVALDQFVWTPVFFVIWLGGFWSMEAGEINTPRLTQQLTDSLPEVMVANWILWIPAQYLNFYACPVKFQVLFVNLIELGWNCYLSFAASGGGHGHASPSKIEDDSNKMGEVTIMDQEDDETNRGAIVAL